MRSFYVWRELCRINRIPDGSSLTGSPQIIIAQVDSINQHWNSQMTLPKSRDYLGSSSLKVFGAMELEWYLKCSVLVLSARVGWLVLQHHYHRIYSCKYSVVTVPALGYWVVWLEYMSCFYDSHQRYLSIPEHVVWEEMDALESVITFLVLMGGLGY